jgi:hypothetical protein
MKPRAATHGRETAVVRQPGRSIDRQRVYFDGPNAATVPPCQVMMVDRPFSAAQEAPEAD